MRFAGYLDGFAIFLFLISKVKGKNTSVIQLPKRPPPSVATRRVACCSVAPYRLLRPTDREVNGSCIRIIGRESTPYLNFSGAPSGLDIELLQILAESLRFHYSLSNLDRDFPALRTTKNNAEVALDLIANDSFHMGIGGFTSVDRWGGANGVAFSSPYLNDDIVLLQRRVVQEFLQIFPMTSLAAGCGVVILLVCTVLLTLSQWLLLPTGTRGSRFVCSARQPVAEYFVHVFFNLVGTLVMQDFRKSECQKTLSATKKALLTTWWLYAFCWVALYSGFLTTGFSVRYAANTVESLLELARQPSVNALLVAQSSSYNWLELRQDDKYYETIWKKIKRQSSPSVVLTYREASKYLLSNSSSRVAILGNKRRFAFEFPNHKACDLYVPLVPVYTQWKAFPVSNKFPYLTQKISETLIDLRQARIPEVYYQYFAHNDPFCKDRKSVRIKEDHVEISLFHLQFVFGSILPVLFAGCFLLIFEIFLGRCTASQNLVIEV